ncbi:hypothetical protein ACJMK2_010501 [Sinanodonta woodiana]|uniref:Uncharacterized protein n=1 Tax=Sinanodonta woodiana TaxID=1069815 RepID=A0ABD3VIM4_SINWO
MASSQQAHTSGKGKVENVSLDVSGQKKCVVCDDILDSAKVLPCTHTFCDSCLDSYLETLSDTENEFPCPMCKVMSPSPRRYSANKRIGGENQNSTMPATSVDQQVPPIDIPGSEDTAKQETNDKSLRDSYPDTLTSIRINNGDTSTPVTARETKRDVETPRGTKGKGKSFSPKNNETLRPYRKCNPCEEMNEIHDAVNFCTSCRESLCAECSRTHKGMKLTKDHTLSPLEEIEPNQLNKAEVSEFCSDHMGNPMVLYCEDHRVPCCNTCVAVHHVRCSNVLSMDRLATLLQEKKAPTLLMARLKQCLLNIDNMTERKTKSQRHLLEQKESSLQQMGQFKDSVIKLLDDLEKRFTDEVENLYDDHIFAIQTHADKMTKMEMTLRNSIKTLKTTMKYGSDTQQVLMMQTLSADCERFERMIHDNINFKDYNFTFMPGEELEASLKTVPSMGIVEIVHKKYFGDLLSCSAKKEGVINVKVAGDNENCIVNSIDITDEGDIILSDYNNMKIKLFDQHGIFRSSTKVNSGPRGVAYLYERKVAISLPDEKLIQILSIEGKYLSQFKNIYTQFKAYRLSFFGNQRMLAICNYETHKTITVITIDGEVERQISKKKGVRGLGGVCFDPVKTYAYVSDKEFVTGYTYAGKRRFQYKFKRTDLRGMTCDLQGNVYVCSRDTRQILQLSPEGKLVKTIVVPMSPQDVAMEPQSNKMVVCGMGNIVHVYRLV